jgi:methionine sulfoxide reductase heme-binding subunit
MSVLASTPALWYLTRGSGAVTLVLLTATVVLGITTSTRWASPRWPRFVTEGLHRNLSLLVLVFLALHVTTTVVDGYAPIGWLDAVVPFGSAYRPAWLGLGAVALDLLVAVAVTSLLRARLGRRAWRAIHWLAYACWPVALAHGLGIGSDRRQGWMLVLDAVAAGAALAALWWRLGTAQPRKGGVAA